MNRTQYLDDLDVRAFIGWMTPRLCAEGVFTHHYGLPHGKAWSCTSVYEAFLRYDWRGDFESNESALAVMTSRLRAALDASDTQEFIAAARDVLLWGGVIANNGAKLLALGDEVIPTFTAAVRQLDPRTADTDHVDDVRLMNAGFTKIFALLIDDFPIYDGRVGAALGYLVRLHLQERGATSVPTTLRFPWGMGKGAISGDSKKNRNPSSGSLIFPRLRADVRLHVRANIMAAWMIAELSRSECFGQLPERQRVWGLQSVLFMIGYEVPR